MRNELLNAYYSQLSPEEAKSFNKRYNQMQPKEREMFLHELSTQMHEIRNRNNARTEWNVGDIMFEDGGEFDKEKRFIPKVNGQEVTYEGLIPVGQQVYLIENEDQGTPQGQARKSIPRSSGNGRSPRGGRIVKGIDAYGLDPAKSLPKEVRERLQTMDGDPGMVFDPKTNVQYATTKDGKYQQVMPRFSADNLPYRQRRGKSGERAPQQDQDNEEPVNPARIPRTIQDLSNARTSYIDRELMGQDVLGTYRAPQQYNTFEPRAKSILERKRDEGQPRSVKDFVDRYSESSSDGASKVLAASLMDAMQNVDRMVWHGDSDYWSANPAAGIDGVPSDPASQSYFLNTQQQPSNYALVPFEGGLVPEPNSQSFFPNVNQNDWNALINQYGKDNLPDFGLMTNQQIINFMDTLRERYNKQ